MINDFCDDDGSDYDDYDDYDEGVWRRSLMTDVW